MPKGTIKLFPVNKDVFMTLLDDYGLSIRKLGDSNIVSCTEKTIRRELNAGGLRPKYINEIAENLEISTFMIQAIDIEAYQLAKAERQFERRSEGELMDKKGTHEITESDKISYAVICDKFPSPHVYFNTYDEAERWAKFNQPNYRPYYIIERSEHFEIVGEIR